MAKPKIDILGDGSFGSFLRDFLKNKFTITSKASSLIITIPASQYTEISPYVLKNKTHLINMASVQESTTVALFRYGKDVTSIHPLFGRRTPARHRNVIITYVDNDCKEASIFLTHFLSLCNHSSYMTTMQHDKLMAKTHKVAVSAAQVCKELIKGAEFVNDVHIPHSFRLLREFVNTLSDMPSGTLDSIMYNEY